MNKLIYNSKNLFTAVGNNIILLSSVSLQPDKEESLTILKIKELYPLVYKDYEFTTELYKKKKIANSLLGKSYWFGYPDCKQRVALVYVSKKIGKWQDPVTTITKRTSLGLDQLLKNLPPSIEIHCNKLNLDVYSAPWADTEKAINNILAKYPQHKLVVHE